MFRTLPFLALLLLSLAFSVPSAHAQESRQVYAYYFGWWTGDSWGDGRLIDRPVALYDSRDPATIARQIDEARGAGIDAFIMSWFGPKNDNLTHQVFNLLLDQAAARGFHAAAALDMVDPGYNATIDEVIASLNYLLNDRIYHAAYLRYAGKPVIYFWNQGRFTLDQWRSIRQQVDPGHGTIWVMEGTNTNYLAVFDGLYLFNTAWAASPGGVAQQWALNTTRAGGTFYTPTVLPGWDESALAAGRPNPTAPQARNNGSFLTNSWNGAVSSGANAILIVSWNEFLENSHVEPSQVYGTQALDLLRPLIAAWKSGAVPPAAIPASPAGVPSGVTYTPEVYLRLRAAPGTDAPEITLVNFGEPLQVIGRLGDNSWLQVNYNGGSGWVSGEYGAVSGDLNAVTVTG